MLAGLRLRGLPWRLATLGVALVWGAVSLAHEAGPADARAATVSRAASSRQRSAATHVQAISLSRIPATQLRSLLFLCHRGPSSSGGFNLGVGENVFGPVAWKRLSAGQQTEFDQQWAAAATASRSLMTPAQATAAGYVQAAPFNSGVGAHWIKWSLVPKAFDPTRPSMLLFDGLPGHAVRLVGFAYWVDSAKEPAGFVGPNDRWHRHSGLCFSKDGWLAEQGVKNAASCDGYWLSGRNLWMLHAWVVPTFPNRWGRFAPTNPALCPPPTKQLTSCQ